MRARRSLPALLMLAAVGLAAALAWLHHAEAWSLGRRSPVLDHDGARHAVAARQVARGGAFGTTFAVPVTLARTPRPPWPVEGVEPGLVAIEALILRLTPRELGRDNFVVGRFSRPDQQEWLVAPIGFTAFLLLALVVALAAWKVVSLHAPHVAPARAALAGATAGLALALDPEAQHLAVTVGPALPFTLGTVATVAALALGRAPERAFRLGLVAGLTVLFRTAAAWLGPLAALAAAGAAPPGRRGAVFARVLAGFALPLLPWWAYLTLAAGTPWGVTAQLAPWDGVQMRSLFAMTHLAELPQLPGGAAGAVLIAGKALARLPGLLLGITVGLGGLQLAALAIAAFDRGLPAALGGAARFALAAVAAIVLGTALTVRDPGALLPARALIAAAGTLAAFALAARLAALARGAPLALPARVLLVALTLGWGLWQTAAAAREARAATRIRATPSTLVLLQLAVMMNREIGAGEPVVSNLGPLLAWHARRPVVHLPLTPLDLEACRERLEFAHVLLAFRGAGEAWPGWDEVVARPRETLDRPELNVTRVRAFRGADGFAIVWLELGPPGPRFAAGPGLSARW